jgi:pyrimidine operon attenuation protein/uracil phosphoribosyltransferase
MTFRDKSRLMSAREIDATISRLAQEILRRRLGLQELVLVGIYRRGVPLAQRLARQIKKQTRHSIPLAHLEVTLYRDDLTTIAAQPVVKTRKLEAPVNGKDLIIVDDVLFTGRTVRASMNALFEHGRPDTVQLCVLIDRDGRELPITADYVGLAVETGPDETIEVRLLEVDGVEEVMLVQRLEDQ